MTPELQALSFTAGSVFTPGAPINEKDLFAGRREQVENIIDAVSQRGYHAILYGERGVGKTSLSNMLSAFLGRRQTALISRINCDTSDTFSSLWMKALKEIDSSTHRRPVGLTSLPPSPPLGLDDDNITPDGVRRALQELSRSTPLVVIFDEFDRVQHAGATVLMDQIFIGLLRPGDDPDYRGSRLGRRADQRTPINRESFDPSPYAQDVRRRDQGHHQEWPHATDDGDR
jgi:hypothetical protein